MKNVTSVIVFSLLAPLLGNAAVFTLEAPIVSVTGSHQGSQGMIDIYNRENMTLGDPQQPSTWTQNSTSWQQDWQASRISGSNGKLGWAVIDLGDDVTVRAIHLWNNRENTARATDEFNMYYSSNPIGLPPEPTGATTQDYDLHGGANNWTSYGTYNLPFRTVSSGAPADLVIDVDNDFTARYVAFELTSALNVDGFNRIGFNEVAVVGTYFGIVPEPGTTGLAFLGMLLVSTMKQRLRRSA